MKKLFTQPKVFVLGFQTEDVLDLSESQISKNDQTTQDGDWNLPINW